MEGLWVGCASGDQVDAERTVAFGPGYRAAVDYRH